MSSVLSPSTSKVTSESMVNDGASPSPPIASVTLPSTLLVPTVSALNVIVIDVGFKTTTRLTVPSSASPVSSIVQPVNVTVAVSPVHANVTHVGSTTIE